MCVCVCFREVGVKGSGRLPGLDSALLGEGSGPEKEGNPLFELRKHSGQGLPVESQIGSSLFVPAAPLGKALGQEELLGWRKGEALQGPHVLLPGVGMGPAQNPA